MPLFRKADDFWGFEIRGTTLWLRQGKQRQKGRVVYELHTDAEDALCRANELQTEKLSDGYTVVSEHWTISKPLSEPRRPTKKKTAKQLPAELARGLEQVFASVGQLDLQGAIDLFLDTPPCAERTWQLEARVEESTHVEESAHVVLARQFTKKWCGSFDDMELDDLELWLHAEADPDIEALSVSLLDEVSPNEHYSSLSRRFRQALRDDAEWGDSLHCSVRFSRIEH